MLDSDIRINRFLVGYCGMLAADIPEERLAEQPLPGVNHPAWILGHLAVTGEAAVSLLGGEKALPAAWGELFGPGSKHTALRSAYPSKAELLRAVEDIYAKARELASTADADRLARPNPSERFSQHLPTVGDAVAFLLTGHLGVHLGQFSSWRRMIGLPAMF